MSGDIILDFFAGSGTTGEAVLKANKDGGNRRFILVQLPEALSEDDSSLTVKNEIELLDSYKLPRNLAYITADRLRRIMIGEGYDGRTDFKWIKDNKKYGHSLEVYYIKEKSIFDSSIFSEIDETAYGIEKIDTLEEKVEWVCKNFQKVARRLKDVTRD